MNNNWRNYFLVILALLVVASDLAVNFLSLYNSTKQMLANTEVQLTSTQTQLATSIAGNNILETNLVQTEGQLSVTRVQLGDKEEQLKTTKAQYDANYKMLRDRIYRRLGLTIEDRQQFITPNDSAISEKVREITTGNESNLLNDVGRIYLWVTDNIKYDNDGYVPLLSSTMSGEFVWRQDYWAKPAETLANKTGDCEDMAVLLASMLKNYDKNSKIWVISMKTLFPKPISHIAVLRLTGGNLTILDPAGKYYTGFRQYGSMRSENPTIAINNWLSYWATAGIPDAVVDEVFGESFHQQFSSTEEFLEWLSQRY